MKNLVRLAALFALVCLAAPASAQSNNSHLPTWWAKLQTLLLQGASPGSGPGHSLQVGANVDVSNECGPQSETFITVNPARPKILAGGSNEIFRLPMRGYFSSDGGVSWGGVEDLPLPPAIGGPNSFRFGSDPSLAFDTQGNVFYGYIVVFFSNFKSAGLNIDGTEMTVARSTDGGKPIPNQLSFPSNLARTTSTTSRSSPPIRT